MTNSSPDASPTDTPQPPNPPRHSQQNDSQQNDKPSNAPTTPPPDPNEASDNEPHATSEQVPTFVVAAANGKRIALITTVLLGLMQVLVTLVVLIAQPAGAPDARAWLFVVSSWLLAGIVLIAVWQIAVFAQQAQLRFEATGVLVSRPRILGMLTRRVLLPYGQLHTARIDTSEFPNALNTTLISDQRSIMFDLLRLQQSGKRVPVHLEQLPSHPFLQALQTQGVQLELRNNPQENWQPLEETT